MDRLANDVQTLYRLQHNMEQLFNITNEEIKTINHNAHTSNYNN